MTRADLIRAVATETGEPLGIVEQIVDATFATIRASLDGGARVEIEGFGKFTMREADERIERRADRVIAHPPYRAPVFKASPSWRKAANAAGCG